ncbi:MAG: hypothetical protein ACR2MS_08595 [Weeksellaceae bacterium]
MRNLIVILSSFVVLSCSSNSKEKEAIETFIETDGKGNKYDLDIKFDQLEISDVSVQDSIYLLEERFEKEKENKISSLEKMKALYEERVDKYSKDKSYMSDYFLKKAKKDLSDQKEKIKEVNNWKPEYLSKYNDRDKSEILCKKADAIVRFENPRLKVEQTIHANFFLNKEGTKCFKMLRIKD